MRALVYDGRVVDISDTEFPVAKPLKWVDAPVGTTTECTYDDELGIVFPAAPTLDDLRAAKYAEIRRIFAVATLVPVIDDTGRSWHGGIDSALKLDGAWRLAERSGASEVSFYDTSNARHHLDLADADEVVKLVAGRYQHHFGRKQALMVAASKAVSVEELEAITW